MRQYRIRDIVTGLYMDATIKKGQSVAWHATGSHWGSLEDVEAHLRHLAEERVVASPLWEVEVVDFELVERYPAVVHAPPTSGRR